MFWCGDRASEDILMKRNSHIWRRWHLDTLGWPSWVLMSLSEAETSNRPETIPRHPKEYVLVLGPLGDPPWPKPSEEILSFIDTG